MSITSTGVILGLVPRIPVREAGERVDFPAAGPTGILWGRRAAPTLRLPENDTLRGL
jgi:hypothetical protein